MSHPQTQPQQNWVPPHHIPSPMAATNNLTEALATPLPASTHALTPLDLNIAPVAPNVPPRPLTRRSRHANSPVTENIPRSNIIPYHTPTAARPVSPEIPILERSPSPIPYLPPGREPSPLPSGPYWAPRPQAPMRSWVGLSQPANQFPLSGHSVCTLENCSDCRPHSREPPPPPQTTPTLPEAELPERGRPRTRTLLPPVEIKQGVPEGPPEHAQPFARVSLSPERRTIIGANQALVESMQRIAIGDSTAPAQGSAVRYMELLDRALVWREDNEGRLYKVRFGGEGTPVGEARWGNASLRNEIDMLVEGGEIEQREW